MIRIAVCNRKTDKKYKNQEHPWEYLKERNKNPIRTTETIEEYHKMKKELSDAAKDHGGFVGGWLKRGSRKNGNVLFRQIGCLDADKIPADVDFPALVAAALPFVDYFIYSTHSHMPEEPRYRLVFRFSRDVSEDEYPAVMRMAAKQIGMDYFDDTTYQANRMMYWSSCAKNGEFIFVEESGDPLNPDHYLDMYEDWRDASQWPVSARQSEAIRQSVKKQQDPLGKSGVVGAFCRAYTIDEVMETFLSDVYAESAIPGRYSYIPADSTAGVVPYEDRWVYSHHASDPAHGRLLNAFDLARVHLYGDLDERAGYDAMAEFAVKDERVSAELLAERRERAARDFDDWEHGLQRAKNGTLLNNLHNVTLIMENDPALKGIVFNELADSMEVKNALPWERPAGVLFWRDADDAQLTCYLDAQYGAFTARHIFNAVTKVVDDRRYHPIRERLEALPPWDLVPRAESIFIDYLGASDNSYVRNVTRKTLCAAVLRVKYPGIKFDHMAVLDGNQGIGKSTLLYKLGGAWFSDSLSLADLSDVKTAAEKLQGQWILEISELEGMNKADTNRVKAFISRQDDKYRAAYGRRVTPHPRQCIIVGTINPDRGYLRDVSGNRRFWPIRLSGKSPKKPWQITDDDVAQIWAEVLVLAESENLYLDPAMEKLAEAEQRGAMEHDEREGLVREYLDVRLPDKWNDMDIYERREFLANPDDPAQPKGKNLRTEVCCLEIWCECFGNKTTNFQPRDSATIRSIMARIENWVRQDNPRRFKHYGVQRFYYNARVTKNV